MRVHCDISSERSEINGILGVSRGRTRVVKRIAITSEGISLNYFTFLKTIY